MLRSLWDGLDVVDIVDVCVIGGCGETATEAEIEIDTCVVEGKMRVSVLVAYSGWCRECTESCWRNDTGGARQDKGG